jgi:preprotein translocase SecF subunit
MEFFKKRTNIDFIGQTRLMVSISLVVCTICLGSIVFRGFNFGIDFAGGTAVELQVPEALGAIDESKMREALAAIGQGEAAIVRVGPPEDRTFRINLNVSQEESRDLSVQLVKGLSEKLGGELTVRSVESIGPRVGDELRRSALWALVLSWVGILAYIWFRFEWQYAPGAVVALIHDVLITAGMFSIFGWEFDLNVLAALLVIIGYSINDTIVIYDRIRETVALRGTTDLDDVVNQSLNSTLSRTILTTGMTLLVVVSILILGGPVLRGMALALLIGMISGVYSTVYVASALLIWLARRYGRAGVARVQRKARATTR